MSGHDSTSCSFFADGFVKERFRSGTVARLLERRGAKIGFKLKAHVDEFTNLGGRGSRLKERDVDRSSGSNLMKKSRGYESDTVGVVTRE